MYLKVGRSKSIIMILYVDETLLASNDTGLLHKTKHIIFKTFVIKDLVRHPLYSVYNSQTGILVC